MIHSKNKLFNLIAVTFYLITLILVIMGQDMLAMYAMAIGMLSGAVWALVVND